MAKGNTPQKPNKLYWKHFKLLRAQATKDIIECRSGKLGLTYFRLPNPPEPLVREWPSGFPEVHIAEYGTESTVWACGSKKLLDWLFATKRSPYDAKMVYDRMQAWQVNMVLPVTSMLDKFIKGEW